MNQTWIHKCILSIDQKKLKTEIIKQGVRICLLGQRWNLLVDYLENGATITKKYNIAVT
jgi:hypothetical protein